MTVAVAGCVAQAEGAGDHPPRAGGRSRGRAAELSSAARTARARRTQAQVDRHRVSGRGQVRSSRRAEPRGDAQARRHRPSSPCRKAATSSAPSASCPTRAAPRSRGRWKDRRRGASGSRRRRRARDHADRPERQRLSRRGRGRPRWHARPAAASRSPRSRASRGCATPPAIRATWTTSLIAAHRDLPQLMPQLHLPVQSGSDRILAAMNRRHTRADYLRTIERLRAARPDLAFSLRFHRRLPGRDARTISATRCGSSTRSAIASAFSFKYSPRPGTPAPRWTIRLPEEVKIRAPAARCKPRSTATRPRSTRAASGATFDVLFERPGRDAWPDRSAARHISSRCRSMAPHAR